MPETPQNGAGARDPPRCTARAGQGQAAQREEGVRSDAGIQRKPEPNGGADPTDGPDGQDRLRAGKGWGAN